MIYLHYKDTKTFGHSFSFLLIFNALSANYLQVGNFSYTNFTNGAGVLGGYNVKSTIWIEKKINSE